MKTMCSAGHHHNGFVATHALGHMMYGYTSLVPNLTKYKLNYKKLSRQNVCVCVCLCVCMDVCVCVCMHV